MADPHGEVSKGSSRDSNWLYLVPNPGTKADTTRTSQKQDPPTHRDVTGVWKLALHSELLRGGRPKL